MTVPAASHPGACNIGRAAREERRRVSLLSFLGAIGYATFVLVSDTPLVLLLGLFGPLSLSIEWGLQASRSFCTALARLGWDAPRSSVAHGGHGRVSARVPCAADRQYAFRLTLVGIVAGTVLTTSSYGVAVALLG